MLTRTTLGTAVLLLLVTASGCRTKSISTGPKVTPAVVAGATGSHDILQTGVQALQAAKTIGVDVTASLPGTAASESVHIDIERPNQVKLLYSVQGHPSNTLVSNGKTLYQWSDTDYVKMPAPKALPQLTPPMDMGLAMQFGGIFILDPTQLTRLSGLKDMGVSVENGVEVHKYDGSYADTQLTLTCAADTGLLKSVTCASGQAMVFTYDHYTLNTPVAPAVFAAVPPKGLHQNEAPLEIPTDIPTEASTEPAQPTLLAAGVAAPDFTLTSARDGKNITLSSLKGKVVLLDFWASWCGPCKLEMPNVQKLHEELGAKGVTVLSINSWDQKQSMESFLKEHPEFTMNVLFDPGQQQDSVASKMYKVSGIPTLYLIDQNGKVVNNYLGYDPDSEATIKAEVAKLGIN